MSDLTVDAQTKLTMRVLDAGLRNDLPTVNELMNQLGDEGGWKAVATTTIAVASALFAAAPIPGSGFVELTAEHIDTGEEASIDQTDLPPDVIAASRILAAVANEDRRAALDVLHVAVDSGYGHDTFGSVLALVVGQLLTIEQYHEQYARYWS